MISKILTPVTTDRPCRHCGKPDWCYTLGELEVCQRGAEPASGWVLTNTQDKEGKTFYAKKKEVRPKSSKTWEYRDRQGNYLLTVHREDDGLGHRRFYQSGNTKTERKGVPVYRHQDIRDSASIPSSSHCLFIVEGESCADALWELGIPATTNLGGAGKWQDSDALDLEGFINIVLCPDRDVPGLKHMDEVEASIRRSLPNACIKWLYPYSDSALWRSPPKSSGVDVADWIKDYKPTKEQILSNLGSKIDLDALAHLRNSYEAESPPDSEDLEATQLEIIDLIGLEDKRFSVKPLLPSEVYEAIAFQSNLMGLREEAYATCLLTGLASLMHPGTTLELAYKFKVNPVLYAAIVSPSGQRKTPLINSMVRDALVRFQIDAQEKYKLEHADWRSQYKRWQTDKNPDKGDEPEEPARDIFFTTDATGEGLAAQVGRQKERGFVILADEINGYFKGQNQYKNGKGNEKELMLSAYDGIGQVTLRKDGLSVEAYQSLVCILGGIQPEVLETLLDNGDETGNWARFIFVHQPMATGRLLARATEETVRHEQAIRQLFERFRNRASFENHYYLSTAAFKTFDDAYNALEAQRVKESNQALQAAISKAQGRIGKLALVLHCLWASHHERLPMLEIQESTIKAAIALSYFYLDQLRLAIAPATLPKHLLKIVRLSERRGGDWVEARDVMAARGKRVPVKTAHKYFSQLANMRLGEVEQGEKGMRFRIPQIN
jgi:uncharacterized protein DUF3987